MNLELSPWLHLCLQCFIVSFTLLTTLQMCFTTSLSYPHFKPQQAFFFSVKKHDTLPSQHQTTDRHSNRVAGEHGGTFSS